jgi:O-antigen/teichoic acid export membrane protein
LSGLLKNAVQLQSARVVQMACALGASVILARAAGPQGLGLYSLVLAMAVIAQGLFSLGLEDLLLARAPRAGSRDGSSESYAIYRQALLVRLRTAGALCVCGLLVAVTLRDREVFGSEHGLALGLALIYAGLNSVATLGAVVQATRVRAGTSAAIDSLWAAGVAVVFFVLAVAGILDATSAVAAICAVQLVANLAYFQVMRDLIVGPAVGKQAIRASEAAVFWLNGLLSIGFSKNSDVVAMQVAGAPNRHIGLFSAAYNANQTVSQIVTQGAGTMFYVGLGAVYSRGDAREINTAWRLTVTGAMFLAAPAITFCLVFPTTVITAIYGSAFAPAAGVLTWLAFFAILNRFVGGGSNQALLFLAERQVSVLVVRTVFVVINVVADVVAYRVSGLTGVAIASGATAAGTCAAELWLCSRTHRLRLPLMTCLKIFLPWLACFIVARAVLPSSAGLGLELVAGAVAATAAVLLLALIKPLPDADLPGSIPHRLRSAFAR